MLSLSSASRFLVLGIVGIGLLCTVIYSGYFYQYDLDELSHVQYAYLQAQGNAPYTDFFARFTPVFSWFLRALFHLLGFTFEGIQMMRVVMGILFLLRLAVMYALFSWVWNRWIAAVSLFLLLLDPFNTFSAMHIRPDNLMMLLYLLGLVFLAKGMNTYSQSLLFFAGFFLSLSCVILLKIIPSLFAIGIGVLGYSWYVRRWKPVGILSVGAAVPIICLIVWAFWSQVAGDMFQQVVLDSQAINASILYPTRAVFFYRPHNALLFGFPGYPLTWWYIWVLPIAAVTSIVTLLISQRWYVLRERSWKDCFVVMLAGSAVVQLFWTYTFPGTFVHYFLAVDWLLAGFFAWGIVWFLHYLKRKQLHARGIGIVIGIFFVACTIVSAQANIRRAEVGNAGLIASYTTAWERIPVGEPSFPNILFRPLAYPFVYGTFIGDMPRSLIDRLGPVHEHLERKHVRYLQVDSFTMMYLHPATQDYIRNHYTEKEKNFWVRTASE